MRRLELGLQYGFVFALLFYSIASFKLLGSVPPRSMIEWIILVNPPASGALVLALVTWLLPDLSIENRFNRTMAFTWPVMYVCLVWLIASLGLTRSLAVASVTERQAILKVWHEPIVLGLGLFLSVGLGLLLTRRKKSSGQASNLG